LKCSFGTSKYCLNFLKEASCESEQCPFLHYVERRRDKVIHDDAEFKDFINTQDRIVQKFMSILELDAVRSKNEFYVAKKELMGQDWLPSPAHILGKSFNEIEISEDKVGKLMAIEFLTFDDKKEKKKQLIQE